MIYSSVVASILHRPYISKNMIPILVYTILTQFYHSSVCFQETQTATLYKQGIKQGLHKT